MELDIFFEPLTYKIESEPGQTDFNRIGDIITVYEKGKPFPSLENIKLALFGVDEDRMALKNKGCAAAPDNVRPYLYQLYSHWTTLKIADLGNIKRGHTVEDTYFAVKEVVAQLIKNGIVPIIIGGSQDLTYANYLAYENIGRIINIATVDPLFDLGHDENELNSRSYLSRIILHQPNFLFNYTNLGYQSYFVNQDAIQLMKNLFFDFYRLGDVRKFPEEVEPMVRDADILSFDMSSIRYSDAPGNFYAGPNGFRGEEACRICYYAGMSDKLSSIGFYELNPDYDPRGQSAHLLAQMIWYFIDGFVNRQGDFPEKDRDSFIRFRVFIDDLNEDLIFLKSKKTGRWWIEVPIKNKANERYGRQHQIPCSYNDYRTALRQELPDRWWKMQQKLM